MNLQQYTIWFCTGSQSLYGPDPLKQVANDALEIVKFLDESMLPFIKIEYKDVLTSPDSILNICKEANNDPECIGLITWMHTFSPAKMWIAGLKALDKPFLHLHTQFNRDIPWDSIDMDFMNLNQSAHGGREFGFMATRLGIDRKIIVGHWKDLKVVESIENWSRVAMTWYETRKMKIVRFGDNMREVAVTEGDKVEAQMQFGYSVYGYGVGDLVTYIQDVNEQEIKELKELYEAIYRIKNKPSQAEEEAIQTAARIELGIKKFLKDGGFNAFTTNFEDLNGMSQIPGIAVQRLMEQGYGFGAEGDWKTAALVRSLKVMSHGLPGGTSFMEDYTYHLDPAHQLVMGAHMLEVCLSLAPGTPSLEVHPLSIGGKDAPPRLVFDVPEGHAVNVSVIDMGNRFRMLVNTVKVVKAPPTPKLPVARALWKPEPDLPTAAAAWILAGGAHHTAFSQALSAQHMIDFAEMMGIECVLIDRDTTIRELKKELRGNEVYYRNSKF